MYNIHEKIVITGEDVRVEGMGRDGEQVLCYISEVGLLELLFQIRNQCTEQEWQTGVEAINSSSLTEPSPELYESLKGLYNEIYALAKEDGLKEPLNEAYKALKKAEEKMGLT